MNSSFLWFPKIEIWTIFFYFNLRIETKVHADVAKDQIEPYELIQQN